MSSGSVRLNVARSHLQHEDPPDDAGREPIHEPPAADGTIHLVRPSGKLWREKGKVLYQDEENPDPVAVRVVWARPLSGRGGPVSVMLAGKKREIAYYPDLEAIPEDSRAIAAEELAGSLILPRITAIFSITPRFGSYYWDVDTDMGKKTFLLTSPENNSIRPSPDVIVIKDVAGNCYEINPVSALNRSSLGELDRVL